MELFVFGVQINIIVVIVYLSMFLDNILLTVVVPIIPDYLFSLEHYDKPLNITRTTHELIPDESEILDQENGKVGILLASKALIQILINPLIGVLTQYLGYNVILFLGSVNLLIASLLFALGDTYLMLLLARSLQGFASSCISVTGMCIVAEQYEDEVHRSKVMGVVLGSIALGVLSGYPVGGFLYDFVNMAAPFVFISALILVDLGLQLTFMSFKSSILEESADSAAVWKTLLSDRLILIILGSIWLSSSAMSILEPCLPIWLMATIKPEKWQLGTVFIPDSVGYLVGTNFFGGIAYRVGRWRVAVAAMLLVGVSCLLVPTARTMSSLVGPHLGLGLGIGILDSALVPLLASVVDSRHSAHYGSIYALQQTAVSLAYSLGPLLGSGLARTMGFSWLMRCVGFINIIYCPALILLSPSLGANKRLGFTDPVVRYSATDITKHNACSKPRVEHYQRFHNPEDSD